MTEQSLFDSLPWESRWRLGEAYGWIDYGMRGSSLEHRKACGLLGIKWLAKALGAQPGSCPAARCRPHVQSRDGLGSLRFA